MNSEFLCYEPRHWLNELRLDGHPQSFILPFFQSEMRFSSRSQPEIAWQLFTAKQSWFQLAFKEDETAS